MGKSGEAKSGEKWGQVSKSGGKVRTSGLKVGKSDKNCEKWQTVRKSGEKWGKSGGK